MELKLEGAFNIANLVAISTQTNIGTFWSDEQFGSELWLIQKSGKTKEETIALVNESVLSSIQPLIDAGLILSAECTSVIIDKQGISYNLVIKKPNGESELIQQTYNEAI